MTHRFSKLRACCAIALLAIVQTADASIQFSGTGNNPEVGVNASGTANFSVTGDILTLVLTNTTSPRTTAQGNALTGVTFDIVGAPALIYDTVGLTAGSNAWTSKTASNTNAVPKGSWTTTLGASPLAGYGIATTGFSGRFNGGSISVGNAAPNYGIVAAGTFDGTSGVSFGGSQFPFYQSSLTFTFKGATGITDLQFKNVSLLFGTDGRGIVPTTTVIVPPPQPVGAPTPEPATIVIWAMIACAGGVAGIRRKY